jgi:choline transport protein
MAEEDEKTVPVLNGDNEEKKTVPVLDGQQNGTESPEEGELINVSGHVQELDRTFGFFSICSIGILSDNAWGAGGGALVVS